MWYCLLPGGHGNSLGEIGLLVRNLKYRKVQFSLLRTPNNCFVFTIPDKELDKLPHDETDHWIGTNDSGHRVYRIKDLGFFSKPPCSEGVWKDNGIPRLPKEA